MMPRIQVYVSALLSHKPQLTWFSIKNTISQRGNPCVSRWFAPIRFLDFFEASLYRSSNHWNIRDYLLHHNNFSLQILWDSSGFFLNCNCNGNRAPWKIGFPVFEVCLRSVCPVGELVSPGDEAALGGHISSFAGFVGPLFPPFSVFPRRSRTPGAIHPRACIRKPKRSML